MRAHFVSFSFAMAVFSLAACGDDDGPPPPADGGPETDGGPFAQALFSAFVDAARSRREPGKQ